MAQVLIIMGSDSDLHVMQEAAKVLDTLSVSYDMRIISAHRTPSLLLSTLKDAADEDVRVVIAGAGMAAALPGMCAALFPLPVIGVPLSSGALSGQDALYSIVQMPPGVPVATVAIDGAKNAAILAVQMLAISDRELFERYAAYRESAADTVRDKDRHLRESRRKGNAS